MVYSEGGAIAASDYNNLIAQINAIFGVGNGDSGYGGNSITVSDIGDLDAVSIGDILTNELWINLRNAFQDCADHQGTILTDGLPSLTDIEDGDIASFFPKLNSSQNIFDITVNRGETAGATLTIPLTSEITTEWSSLIQHVFTVKFVDSDHARYFFNAGGTIRIAASRVGGNGNPQSAAWSSILIPANDFIFTGEHYFGLTGALENLRDQISPLSGAYSSSGPFAIGNIWTVLGKRMGIEGPNGGNGSEIMIQSNFLDGGTNAPDIVDGVLTSVITESKHPAVFNIASPIYTTTIPLSINFTPTSVIPDITINILADDNNWSLSDTLIGLGWNGILPIDVIIYVDTGVRVGSLISATAGMTIENLPAGSSVSLNNQGTINGYGGTGAGGDALAVATTTILNNTGEIYGGGGQGTTGAAGITQSGYTGGVNCGTLISFSAPGGAGGAGYGNSINANGGGGVTVGQSLFDKVGDVCNGPNTLFSVSSPGSAGGGKGTAAAFPAGNWCVGFNNIDGSSTIGITFGGTTP